MADILVVEDNPGDQRLIAEAFRAGDGEYKLHIVSDGAEALDFLLQRGSFANAVHPELILLDLNLPKKHGSEVLQEVKRHPRLRHIPVLILTTSDSEEDARNCYTLGANSYIVKPQELLDLFQIIHAIRSYWFETVKLH